MMFLFHTRNINPTLFTFFFVWYFFTSVNITPIFAYLLVDFKDSVLSTLRFLFISSITVLLLVILLLLLLLLSLLCHQNRSYYCFYYYYSYHFYYYFFIFNKSKELLLQTG